MMEIEVVQLQAVSRILQSIHHRNKNQHGQSTWWKWLAMLKRCVGNLVKELERKDSKRTRARMEYMRENLLPKCYVAFTQLIQDNQFSALGLTLLAELAKTQSVIGTGGGEAEEPMETEVVPMISKYEHVAKLSEDLGEAVGRSTAIASEPKDPKLSSTELSGSQTFKDVQQPAQGCEIEATGQSENVNDPPIRLRKQDGSAPIVSRLKATPMIAKKQKRKPANPIDDLFHGLD